MKSDLTYKKSGLFTLFLPETSAGYAAWAELAKRNDGTGKIFTAHLDQTLRQLRKTGYSVAAANKISANDEMSEDELLAELLDNT